MGSEMLGRSGESGGGKSLGSAVLAEGKGEDGGGERGWDWRTSFKGKEVDGVGREVLRTLRRGVAGELSWRELDES